MTEGKRVGRKRRRRMQLLVLDELRNRRYWEITEETEDKKSGNENLSCGYKKKYKSSSTSP
jgi:hypothetical protein